MNTHFLGRPKSQRKKGLTYWASSRGFVFVRSCYVVFQLGLTRQLPRSFPTFSYYIVSITFCSMGPRPLGPMGPYLIHALTIVNTCFKTCLLNCLLNCLLYCFFCWVLFFVGPWPGPLALALDHHDHDHDDDDHDHDGDDY